jgi:hypothetical protein
MIKNFKTTISICAAGVLAACGGSAGDPKTLTKDELNPPSGLVTVTGDKQIELRWLGNNTEDDLRGYQVFGYKDNADDSKSAYEEVVSRIKYPKAGVNSAIPRCKDNDEVFRLFGFTKNSDAKCKGDDSAETSSFSEGSELAMADADEVLSNKLTCETGSTAVSDANVSLPTERALEVQRCIVKKVGGEDLVNGVNYVFFVAAVKGDKFNKLSWTSTFVKDTPAAQLFSENVTFEPAKFKKFAINTSTFGAITAGTGDCPGSDNVCSLSNPNTASESAIYVSRRGSADTSYPQRILISTPDGGDIKILQRGAETFDPLAAAGTVATSTPRDRAANTTTYFKGAHVPVYGNQVFDIQIERGGSTYYGKIVFSDPAGTAAGDITMKVTILMQPKAGEFDYFMD